MRAFASPGRSSCASSVALSVALLSLVSCAGQCTARQSTLSPADAPPAHMLASVGWFALVVVCVVAAVMLVLIVGGALHARGSLEEHAPFDEEGGHGWIWVGGVVVPVVVLAAFFVVSLRGMTDATLHEGHGADAAREGHLPEIVVTGHQFWWEVTYPGSSPSDRITTANEIHIPTGQPVEIALRSADVIHSFWIPRLHGKVDLVPGRENRIRIEADTPGVYAGQCAEFCGVDHALMRIVVVAEPPSSFAAWVAASIEPALAPDDVELARGKQLFESRACALCHTIRGTPAGGRLGPDLTHIGSRMRIGSEIMPNDPAHLEAWITRAQTFKPGAQMPNITDFSGEELRVVTRYLLSLQ